MAGQRVLGLVLAGGAGKRLAPLTADRAKPAVPFGGLYRLVDFTLSNLVNAGCQRICVLTQYKSHSLDRHLITTWRLSSLLDNYVTPVPAQQRLRPALANGLCGCDLPVTQPHLRRPARHRDGLRGRSRVPDGPEADDQAHLAWGAGATVATVPVPRMEATESAWRRPGRMATASRHSWKDPADPPVCPGQRDSAFASMGNYVFDSDVLVEALTKDAADDNSQHAMGGDIMPMLVRARAAHVYDFAENKVPGAEAGDLGYWRDVGTLDSYFDAHMDLCAAHPVFNLYNDRWPILTQGPPQPPAKFVHNDGDRVGRAINSVISNGVIVSGGLVRNSVLSPGARVDSWARVERSVLLHDTRVNRHAVVENAILDKNVVVLEGATVGVDKEHDRARGFVVSEGGVTVVGKGQLVTPLPPAPSAGQRRRLEQLERGGQLIGPGCPAGHPRPVAASWGGGRSALDPALGPAAGRPASALPPFPSFQATGLACRAFRIRLDTARQGRRPRRRGRSRTPPRTVSSRSLAGISAARSGPRPPLTRMRTASAR